MVASCKAAWRWQLLPVKRLLQQKWHDAMKNSSSWTEIHQRKLHA